MARLLVFVAVVAVYVQSLGGPFLWDDRMLILGAPLVEQGGSLGDFLSAPFWTGSATYRASSSYYRPLVTLSFALDNAIHAGNAAGFHLTNVVLHATNALLLYALVKKYGTRAPTAALVALGWALLPRLSEAAAWISGRTDLLAALSTLGALLAWGPSITRRIVAALLLGLGLFAKESAVAGALCIAASVWLGSEALPARRRLLHTFSTLAPLALPLLGYAALRIGAVGIKDQTENLGFVGRILTIFEASGTYAAMLIDAWRPRAVIGRQGVTSASGVAAGIAVLALVAILIRFRSRLGLGQTIGALLFFGALLPVLHIVPIPLRTLAADRFLYLPTAGLALVFAPGLERWMGARRARWAAALALIGSFAVVTFQRIGTWSDEVDFWVQAYRETPTTNAAAANELASVYYRAGLYEDALILSERALRYDDPQRATAEYNTVLCRARLGYHDDATRAKLEALRGKGRWVGDVELLLALLEIRNGRFEAASAILKPFETSGNPLMRELSSRLGELEQARRELEMLDASSPPERRAALATLLDEEVVAARAWSDILDMPNVSKPLAARAMKFFVQRGDRQALAKGASAYRSRFGSIEPDLASMIDVRLAELDRLIVARPSVGLSGPERTREIAKPVL